ncbi:MAG: LptA/OstA family protein [bacterium]|nr:LptA/OstA family protein [bacterium]
MTIEKKFYSIYWVILFLLFSFSVRAEVVVDDNKKKDKINIKSDKVEYNFKEGEEIAVFTGSVEMKKGDLTVYSDKMQMYSQGKKVIGDDNVKIIVDNEKENRVMTSGYYEYHRDDEYGILKINPKMVIINKKQSSEKNNENKDKKNVKDFKNLTVTSDVMEMFSKEGYSKAIGKVVMEEGDRKAYCDEAIYYEKEDKVVMTGSPRIEQKDNVFNGEKMIFFLNDNRLIIEGKVEGTILEEDKKNKEEKKAGDKIEQ